MMHITSENKESTFSFNGSNGTQMDIVGVTYASNSLLFDAFITLL